VQGLNLKQIYTRSLIAAFCFHAYQQVSLHDSSCRNYCIYLFLKLHHWCWFQIVLYACTNSIPCVCMVSEHSQFKIYWLNLALILLKVSYMILARVSPVTHSVGNCVKRVVVIVTSVLFFRTPVSPVNSIGPHLLSFTHWLNQSCYFFHPSSQITNTWFVQVPGLPSREFSSTHNWRGLSPSPRLLDRIYGCQVHPVQLSKPCHAVRVISESPSLEWYWEKLLSGLLPLHVIVCDFITSIFERICWCINNFAVVFFFRSCAFYTPLKLNCQGALCLC
jgi:hypothetical protein